MHISVGAGLGWAEGSGDGSAVGSAVGMALGVAHLCLCWVWRRRAESETRIVRVDGKGRGWGKSTRGGEAASEGRRGGAPSTYRAERVARGDIPVACDSARERSNLRGHLRSGR